MSRFTVSVARGKTVEIDSLLAAGRAVRDEIEGPLGWVGCREWTLKHAGHRDGAVVYEGTQVGERLVKTPVAVVSYNGRVWSLDGSEVTT